MKVLLDECLPRKLKYDLPGHTVFTVAEMGWKGRWDGPLLPLAEQAGFEVLVTIDGSLEHQQNLGARALGFVVFKGAPRNTYDVLHPLMPQVALALSTITPGEVIHITT